MKILYYNWADPLGGQGGGVTVYLRALLQNMHPMANEVYFLSSGFAYNNGEVFYRRTKNRADAFPNRFEIVNSSIIAPGQLEELEHCPVDDDKTIAVFLEFVDKHGPFDIIHAHNLEGLPLRSFAEARKKYASTTFMITLHNYYPLCPEVELWDGRTYCSCDNYLDGLRCHNCFIRSNRGKEPLKRYLKELRINRKPVKRAIVKIWAKLQRRHKNKTLLADNCITEENTQESTDRNCVPDAEYLREFLHPNAATYQAHYQNRRAEFSAVLANSFDAVICVSKRVKEIYQRFGHEKLHEKLHVMHLGTQHATVYQKTQPPTGTIPNREDQFNIGYAGYATHPKGFYFFLDSLEMMPTTLSRTMGVIIIAKIVESQARYRINRIRNKFRFIRHIDGYTPLNFDNAVKDVSLLVVPHLWEEAFGLAAMEAHCRKIPLLCSDLGGTKEIANFPEFVFRHGDSVDLIDRLSRIANQKYTYEQYFYDALTPKNMHDHIDELLAFYLEVASTRKNANQEKVYPG